jgi:hypothetical protein
MANGDQWEEAMITARGESRPRVVVNLLDQHILQSINAFRQNKPGGKVDPVDNQADPETAEIIEAHIRNIEYQSNAGYAYETAIKYVTTGGFSFWGLDIDFSGVDTLDQELRVIRCADPKLWMIDPASIAPDGSDAKWFIELKRYSREEFEDSYPDSEAAMTDFSPPTDYADWIDSDGVWLCNYWEVKTKKRKLARISASGQTEDVFLDDLEKPDREAVEAEAEAIRDVDYPVVTCYLINGLEVLDETEWPGTRIPRYPAYGHETYVQGERRLKSLISDALEPQRMLNYHESLNVEAIALAPTPKWLMPEGADEGLDTDWTNPNKARNKVLHWKQTSWGESVPPIWQVFEPKSQAMDIGAQRAQEYIKSTTGQFDPSLGALDPGARSGKAIEALKAQGANATSHFAAALIPGLNRMYRDIIEVLPKVYRPGQSIRIVGPDQAQKVLQVGQVISQNTQGGKTLDFATGRYDVTVSIGPSQASQREEATEFADTLLNSPVGQNPQIAPKLTAKIIQLRQLGPIGDDLQELLDPQPKPNDPEQQAQQMQQMAQMNEQLTQELQRVTRVMETKQAEIQAKSQSDLAVEDRKFQHEAVLKEMDHRVELILGEAKISAQYGLADIKNQLTSIQQQLKMAHDVGMARLGHVQSREAQDITHEQGLEVQERAAELAPQPRNGSAGSGG